MVWYVGTVVWYEGTVVWYEGTVVWYEGTVVWYEGTVVWFINDGWFTNGGTEFWLWRDGEVTLCRLYDCDGVAAGDLSSDHGDGASVYINGPVIQRK